MAPKIKPPKRLQTAVSDDKEKEHRINLGDSSALKRALDDVVVEVSGPGRPLCRGAPVIRCQSCSHTAPLARQELKAGGYSVDYTYFDLKIVLGLAA